MAKMTEKPYPLGPHNLVPRTFTQGKGPGNEVEGRTYLYSPYKELKSVWPQQQTDESAGSLVDLDQ